MRTLILDNYDSFTFNLSQAVAALGGEPVVVRNDALDVAALAKQQFTHIILGPGPGSPTVPRDIGVSRELIGYALTHKIPFLGVCLGHQVLGVHFGATVKRTAPRHGKASMITFTETRSLLFSGLPVSIEAMRYHSLCVEDLPAVLLPTAYAEDGILMAMEHVDAPIYGVQFHPESIGTPDGPSILKNFLTFK